MTGITVITGGGRGIGLELARQLKAKGHAVLVACRTRTAELDALGVEVVDGLALDESGSHVRLLAAIGGRKVDLLVHNAGLLAGGKLDSEREEDIAAQFRINAMTPVLLTRALLPVMAQPGKIAIITSRMGSISDNTSGGYYGYRMSKAAVNAAGVVAGARSAQPRHRRRAAAPGFRAHAHDRRSGAPGAGRIGAPADRAHRGADARRYGRLLALRRDAAGVVRGERPVQAGLPPSATRKPLSWRWTLPSRPSHDKKPRAVEAPLPSVGEGLGRGGCQAA
jgi:NAD(P)-dependent dehydrogenase (short-subunit alcohol dehydrogenase family)